MSQFVPSPPAFANLKGKVVVVTGGANGIGAATVSGLFEAGALVVFGDNATSAGETLMRSLHPSARSSGTTGSVEFVYCNVAEYEDNYELFKTAYDRYGRVDHAIACAGITEQGKWFDPELTIDTVKEPATTAVLDVNLVGSSMFARLAVVFLQHGRQAGDDKSITFAASVASFRESPGLYMYQTSKHGILGLMRSMRKPIFERGIRVNCVCPGMTETPMTTAVVGAFKEAGINQTAGDVANIILGIQTTPAMNGKAIYSEGGQGWEFEDGYYHNMPRWLGEEPTRMLRTNLALVAGGALLK